MTHDAAETPPMKLGDGLLLLLFVIVGVVAWVILGPKVGLSAGALFASFSLLWYWAVVEKATFNRLPHSVIGALVGVGLAWCMQDLPHVLGANGMYAAYAIVALVLLLQILNTVPLVINPATMLFLTVLAAPALLTSVNMTEIAWAVITGGAFFAGMVWGAHQFVAWRDRNKSAA